MAGVEMRDWKMHDQVEGVENPRSSGKMTCSFDLFDPFFDRLIYFRPSRSGPPFFSQPV